jgi:hypothetical protein
MLDYNRFAEIVLSELAIEGDIFADYFVELTGCSFVLFVGYWSRL